jgi:hypothetical protein
MAFAGLYTGLEISVKQKFVHDSPAKLAQNTRNLSFFSRMLATHDRCLNNLPLVVHREGCRFTSSYALVHRILYTGESRTRNKFS